MDDYAIREAADARRRAWREADPDRTLGGGLTLAGVMLHGWVRNAPQNRIPEKPHVASDSPAAGLHGKVPGWQLS